MSWKQTFHEPIELPDGRILRTLRDAGEFIQELPTTAQDRPEWQAAAKALLLVVECNGDTMLARIGMMRALKAGKSSEPPAPRRQETPYNPVNGDQKTPVNRERSIALAQP